MRLRHLVALLVAVALMVSCTVARPSPTTTPTLTPAKFTVSALTVTPSTVRPGEMVTVMVTVANTGGSQGKYTVVFDVNGVVEATEEVALDPNEKRNVSFSVKRNTADTYRVSVDGLSSSFAVKKVESTPTPKPDPLDEYALAYIYDGRLWLRTKNPIRQQKIAEGVSFFTASQDGKRVAYMKGTALFCSDLGSLEERQLTSPLPEGYSEGPPSNFVLSPDWRFLAFSYFTPGGSKWVSLVDITSGKVIRQWLTLGDESYVVGWSYDSQWCLVDVTSYGSRSLQLVTVADKSLRELAKYAEGSFSPNKPLLVVNERDQYILDLVSGFKTTLSLPYSYIGRLKWSPNGQYIAFVADGFVAGAGDRPQLYVIQADGTGARRLTNREIDWEGYHWSNDGRYLIYTYRDGTWALDISSGAETLLTPGLSTYADLLPPVNR